LEKCAPHAHTDLQRDINAGWQAIGAASVDETLRAKNWQSWLKFCSDARCDPYLQQTAKSVQQNLLIGFAARVRRGHSGSQVQSHTPEIVLHNMAQTIVLAGYANLRRSYGCKDLNLPFPRLLKTYKCND
jgi:hypothetical protein